MSPHHVLALLKCAVEGVPLATHFGSLLGLAYHHGAGVELGLLESGPNLYEPIPTPAGRIFYDQFRLAEFPAGRANAWGYLNRDGHQFVQSAADELERLACATT